MKIKSIDIQNFRKIKSVHIDISDETTVFVKANNSGKLCYVCPSIFSS